MRRFAAANTCESLATRIDWRLGTIDVLSDLFLLHAAPVVSGLTFIARAFRD